MKIAIDRAPRPAASLIARVLQRWVDFSKTAATPNSLAQEPGSGLPAPGNETAPKTRPGRWPELPSNLPRHNAVASLTLPPNGKDKAPTAETIANPVQYRQDLKSCAIECLGLGSPPQPR
jgi:hypothetical protein